MSRSRVPLQDEYWHKTEVKVNDELDLVYRPQGVCFNLQYMSTCKRSGRVSVHCWGWISHEGAGVPHRIEGQLHGLQYQHILQSVMVISWEIQPQQLTDTRPLRLQVDIYCGL